MVSDSPEPKPLDRGQVLSRMRQVIDALLTGVHASGGWTPTALLLVMADGEGLVLLPMAPAKGRFELWTEQLPDGVRPKPTNDSGTAADRDRQEGGPNDERPGQNDR